MKALLLLILLLPLQLHARWDKVGQFNRIISSGFFLNEKVGFIGSGSFSLILNSSVRIWRTADGGLTWQPCQVPFVDNGRVTSIFMVNSVVGYASITDKDFLGDGGQALWKTTDGGIVWTDHTQGNDAQANCVYATPNALIYTAWTRSGGPPGGFSLDDGAVMNNIFVSGSQNEYNGIDFTDDLNGVVSTGPTLGFARPCFFTTNGGRSWNEGGDMPESWGVYGVRNSNLFIALSEGWQINPTRTVWVSTNVGRSWTVKFTFSGTEEFTGHIAGGGNAVYVQTSIATNSGLFRSDDLGVTWKNVGGPSNERDTRFAVTGCAGQIVYAFDDAGGVWKTSDGGDGTLTGGNGTDLTLNFDSLTLTTVCTPVRDWIPVIYNGCGDTVIVDELKIENDITSQFTLDTISSGLVGSTGEVFLIPIIYSPKNTGSQEVRLRLRAHSSSGTIDTIITITGRTVKLPEPYVPDIERGEAGDTVRIPIYLDKTLDPFSITEYEMRMSFNTDLIEAIAIDTIGTLTRFIRNHSFVPLSSGVFCRFSLLKPIDESGDLSQPLLILLARVYLTSQATTTAIVDSFNVTSGFLRASLLGCSERRSSFTINYVCGDSTISAFMRTGAVSISNIRPNPNMTSSLDLEVGAAQGMEIRLEAVNALGVLVKRFDPLLVSTGSNIVRISTEDMVSGLYYFRLTSPYGIAISDPVAIVR